MFVEQYSILKSLRNRTASFRRVALHVHSPESHDWAKSRGDPTRNDRNRFDGDHGISEFVEELKPHLDLVAITDHMKCGYATAVSKTVGSDGDFVVLPGMEVNLVPEAALGYARIHLLVILPERSDKAMFERLFAGLGMPPDDERTGKEQVVGITLSKWVERVHDEHGICIAAHIDDKNGVRYLFRQTSRETLRIFSDADRENMEREANVPDNLRRYLFAAKIDAVEVARSTDASHYRWESELDGKPCWIPTILHSDPHCLEDLERREKVTHIKMTSPGIHDLKSAFKFPDTRIRFPDNLPDTPEPILRGVQIIGDSNSFFEQLMVAPAQNLNCLIGVRGSGKSTVVEVLRYVFGYNRTLDELGDLGKSVRELQQTNFRGCLLRVFYKTRGGDDHVLEATFDGHHDYVTKVYNSEGDYLNIADAEQSGEYPLRLFGWSEIELLGRSASKQRDLLDRLVPGLNEVLTRRRELRTQLKVNRRSISQAIETLRAAYLANDQGIRRYVACKKDFAKLNTPEVQRLFSALDIVQGKLQILTNVKANAERLREKFAGVQGISLRDNLDTLLEDCSQALKDWWQGEELPALNIIGVEQDVAGLLQQAVKRLESFETQIGEHIKAKELETATINRQLRDGLSSDATKQKVADLRANAEKRLGEATRLRNEYIRAKDGLMDVLKERKDITDLIESTQNEIAGIRAKHDTEVQGKLNEFLPAEMKMSIDFVPGGDTGKFQEAILPFLRKVNRYKARNLDSVIAHHYTPVSFARALAKNELVDLIGKSLKIAEETSVLTSDDVEQISINTNPFAKDEHADVVVLADDGSRLETIMDLQETYWDDRETILLNDRPVNEVSPGQRSSVMLPLIALAESTPLVIDQPEDNLDKRLIGRVLVKILSELKEKRQIIVCTHDPNILVGGDAEQVIVLEAVSDRRGKVAIHGSIDNSDIVKTVLDLLEGGEEAFENRRRRYYPA